MISFHAFGVRFKLPLLTIILPVLAARLGNVVSLLPVLLALGMHELAHLLAARLTGVAITEISLMPFGGSARMENPYQLPACKLIVVALSGPLTNLLLAVCFAALAHWNVLFSNAAHIQANLVLFFFNLLPALPLDGGRIAFALLRPCLEETRAMDVCIWTGRIVAVLLFLAALHTFVRSGLCNLTLILAAMFILASARDERSALAKSHAQRMAALLNIGRNPLPLRFLQADESFSVHAALRILQPGSRTCFVLSRGGTPVSVLSDQNILAHLVENGAPEAALGELQAWQLPGQRTSGADSVI